MCIWLGLGALYSYPFTVDNVYLSTHSFNEIYHFHGLSYLSLFMAFGGLELDVPPQEKFYKCSGKMDLPFWLFSVYMQSPIFFKVHSDLEILYYISQSDLNRD